MCLAFLGHTLDSNKIDSYSGVLNSPSEEAYGEALEAISILNSNIEGLQLIINELTQKSDLAENEKKEVFNKIEVGRKSRELALVTLSDFQTAKVAKLTKMQEYLPLQQQLQRLYQQDQEIRKQLDNVQQQQQQLPEFIGVLSD